MTLTQLSSGPLHAAVLREVTPARAVGRGSRDAEQTGTLLPAPDSVGLEGLLAIYALLERGKESELSSGEMRILNGKAEKDEWNRKMTEALEREQKAKEDEGGFWDKVESGAKAVATVAAGVGAVAATVASCGAAAPVAVLVISGVALSAGGMAIGETKCLDGILGDGASAKVGLGMSLGGAALNVTGGLLLAGSAATAASSSVASSVATGAGLTAGGSQVVQGTAHMKVQGFAADAQDAGSDAQRSKNEAERTERRVATIISSLESAITSKTHAAKAIQGAIQAQNDSLLCAASGSKKG